MKINSKYKPLFSENTRYYVITGSRFSGKSFVVSLFLTLKLKFKDIVVLFTRWTLTSANDSIIPEFNEKIELLGESESYNVTTYDIHHKGTGSTVLFRGIKTSQGIQTAKLKSLTGVNIWVLDEAEELVDETVFNKIDLSVRSNKAKNLIILILNPSYRSHWIYKRFFLNANVPELFNGVKGDVTYIHTDYRDNIENLPDDILQQVTELKAKNPQRYNEEILGHWKDEPEGVLFKQNELKYFNPGDLSNKTPELCIGHIDVADQGNDYLCFVLCKVFGQRVFITDVVYSKDGERVTRAKVSEKLNTNFAETCLVESNNQGKLYGAMLKDMCENTRIVPYAVTTNKDLRIFAQHEWIAENVHFIAPEHQNTEYSEFMRALTTYNSNGKNENDDAPDSLAGLAKYLRTVARL